MFQSERALRAMSRLAAFTCLATAFIGAPRVRLRAIDAEAAGISGGYRGKDEQRLLAWSMILARNSLSIYV